MGMRDGTCLDHPEGRPVDVLPAPDCDENEGQIFALEGRFRTGSVTRRTPTTGGSMRMKNCISMVVSVALAALVATLGVTAAYAGTACAFLPAGAFRGTLATNTTGATTTTTAGSGTNPTKSLWSFPQHATNKNGVFTEFMFPVTHVTTDALFTCNVKFRINSTTTANVVGWLCRYEVSIDGADWNANDGLAATAIEAQSNVVSSANVDISTSIASVQAYDQKNSAACPNSTSCQKQHGILVVQRASNAEITGGLTNDTAAAELESVVPCWTTP